MVHFFFQLSRPVTKSFIWKAGMFTAIPPMPHSKSFFFGFDSLLYYSFSKIRQKWNPVEWCDYPVEFLMRWAMADHSLWFLFLTLHMGIPALRSPRLFSFLKMTPAQVESIVFLRQLDKEKWPEPKVMHNSLTLFTRSNCWLEGIYGLWCCFFESCFSTM